MSSQNATGLEASYNPKSTWIGFYTLTPSVPLGTPYNLSGS